MDILANFLLGPLQYPFMVRGLLAAGMVGIVCAVIGTFVVLRGLAFIGDALAHAVLPGVAIAYLLGANIFVGAFIAALVVALGIGAISRSSELREDTAVGIVFVGALALGVLLISTARSYTVDLAHILFGNVLAVSNEDLILIAGVGLVVLAIVRLFFKELVLSSFDPVMAATIRLPVNRLNYLLYILIALAIVISLRAVGNILVVAMLIAPAATAYLLTERLSAMMVIAALVAVISAAVGLYASFYWNVASGAAIVLTATVIFFVVLAWNNLTRVRKAR
jgi:ABC-type Mn2+/Zn2+ transport system permease subunit